MKQLLKLFLKHLFLFVIGGFTYLLIEILFRGYSHISMFVVGGICFVLIGLLNEIYTWEFPLWKQVVIADTTVLIIEFISGCILNLWLNLNVWDYSHLPLNLLGQICLPFALLWIPVCVFAIILDDYVRYYFFDEEKPYYTLF